MRNQFYIKFKPCKLLYLLCLSFAIVSCNNSGGGGGNKPQNPPSTQNPEAIENTELTSTVFNNYGLGNLSKSGIPLSPFFLPLYNHFNNINSNYPNYFAIPASINQDEYANSYANDSMALTILNGQPVVAYIDPSNNNGLTLIEEYQNQMPGNGQLNGQIKVLAKTDTSNVSHIKMTEDNGNLLVAYKNSNGYAAVREYRTNNQTSGTDLRIVGSNGNSISAYPIRDIALANGVTPIVAYIQDNNGTQSLGVSTYSYLQSNGNQVNDWVPFHQDSLNSFLSTAETNGSINRLSIRALSIAKDPSNNLFVAFNSDRLPGQPNTSALIVLEYDNAQSQWIALAGAGAPSITSTGAYETRLAIDEDSNLILAYVERSTGKLSVQKYTKPGVGNSSNSIGTWSYIGSLNQNMLNDQNVNQKGTVTGHNIVGARGINLAIAPSKVSNTLNSVKVLGAKKEAYLHINSKLEANLANSGAKFAKQGILISFINNDPSSSIYNTPQIIAYDGNLWQLINKRFGNYMNNDAPVANQTYATDVAIDKNNGYYYFAHVSSHINSTATSNQKLYLSYAPQSPFTQIIYTSTPLDPNFMAEVTSMPFGDTNGYCLADNSYPFGKNYYKFQWGPNGFSDASSTVAAYIRNLDLITPQNDLLDIGANYYNLDYMYVGTAIISPFDAQQTIGPLPLYNPVGIRLGGSDGAPVYTMIDNGCPAFMGFSGHVGEQWKSSPTLNNLYVNSNSDTDTFCATEIPAAIYCVTR